MPRFAYSSFFLQPALLLASLMSISADSASGGSVPAEFGFAVEGLPDRPALRTLASVTGVQPRLVLFYIDWPAKPEAGFFPGASLRAIASSGALPVLTWQPMFSDPKTGEQMIPAELITAGTYDVYLEQMARERR